jgi:tRNA dimethylallyltransferase
MIYNPSEVKVFMLNPPRDELYQKINERVDLMIKLGLEEEVKSLLEKYNLSKTARAAIGYKEMISYFNGELSKDAAIELIKKRTRNYAKRQITFFKHQLPVINVKNFEEIKEILENEQD